VGALIVPKRAKEFKFYTYPLQTCSAPVALVWVDPGTNDIAIGNHNSVIFSLRRTDMLYMSRFIKCTAYVDSKGMTMNDGLEKF
jgi:hypothetical protein